MLLLLLLLWLWLCVQVWPTLDPIVCELVRSSIEPLLDDMKPPIIARMGFQRLTLGVSDSDKPAAAAAAIKTLAGSSSHSSSSGGGSSSTSQ
jgi:Ca2+-dependent lipid-binding protein